jgi:hypothetical protein
MIAALAEKHRFFHWHLAFPDVYTDEARGFDVILGNPPWERIKLQEKEYFADKAPEIANARTAAQRRKRIKRLPETDPTLHAAYVDALHGSEALSIYLRESGRYPLSAVGDINTYQVFAGLVRQIVDGRGRVGIVVPTGIATDYFNQDYFAALVDNRELVSLYDFENRAKLFPDVDSRYKFSLLTLTGARAPADEADFAFFLHQVSDLQDDQRRFALSAEDLARINPNTKTCPVFRTRGDAELTAKLYRAAPVLINEAEGTNPWGIELLQGLFHTSGDSSIFLTREELESLPGEFVKGGVYQSDENSYLPLIEPRMLNLWDHRSCSVGFSETAFQRSGTTLETKPEQHKDPHYFVTPRYWVPKSSVKERLDDWDLFTPCTCCRRITSPTNERTMIGALVPQPVVSENGIVMFLTVSNLETCAFVANLDSFVFDYVVRQKTNVALGNFVLKQLPTLPPDRYTPDLLRFIVPRVLELTYTAWDLQPFADDVWAEAREMGRKGEGERGGTPLQAALLQQWKANQRVVAPTPPPPVTPSPPHTTDFPRPPFTWDEARRSQLRAELDALYAHLYGLSREELAYILETFPIVKRKDEAQYGEYRTKRLVLEAYEELP